MSEIDVSKCAFYYSNGKCNNPNGTACNCSNTAYCYYKHLQQLKLDLIIQNEALKQSEQEGLKIIAELKAENEELRNKNQKMYKMGCKNFVAIEQAKRLYKINKCIDDIKGIINNFADEDIITLPDLSKEKNYKLIAEQYAEPIKQIMEKIKQAKGE